MEETNTGMMGGEHEHEHYHCCGRGHFHGHFLLRWILGLIILGVVFGIGVKVGEFKAEFGYGYGFGHMRYFAPMMYGNDSGYYYNMMNWNPNTAAPSQPKTTTPSK